MLTTLDLYVFTHLLLGGRVGCARAAFDARSRTVMFLQTTKIPSTGLYTFYCCIHCVA